jgi:isoamylase
VWHMGWVRCIGLKLNGRTLDDVNEVGDPVIDDTFLILFNPHHEPIRFYLPAPRPGTDWELVLDTRNAFVGRATRLKARKYYRLIDRSLALLREVPVSAPPEPSAVATETDL